MSTLNLTATLPGDQSGVAITTKLDGYTIKWDPQVTGETVEVWQHTSNVRTVATMVATVADTYYDSPTLNIGTTYYVWTRRVSAFGVTGNWDLGETAGRTIAVTGVKVANQAVGLVSSTTVSLTTNVATTTPSTYNSWTETGSYMQFTAPSGATRISGFLILSTSVTGESHSGADATGYIQSRLRVRNHTDSVDLASLTRYHTHDWLDASSGVVDIISVPIATYDIKINSGFGDGALIPGKVYRIYLDFIKTRTASSLTYSLNGMSLYLTNGTKDSATVS